MVNANEIIDNAKSKMKKTEDSLHQELGTIRAGRANASLLNPVLVEYYGAQVPLNQVASISIPEARMILVSPYDVSALSAIERGIQEADLGINPMNDGEAVRIVIPQLTEERRKELAKKVKSVGEDTKIATRNVRRDAMEAAKKGNKNDDFTDDELHGLEDDIQKLTDKSIKVIDEIVSEKDKEIMNG
ncbi:ribosome recycling factor [Lactobacillus sp. S2-2]|uniref:ribosome recycling factor n=1 Tax=Lactobacillus sp. S2-2 TaxID=2692917 RepID=UPI001F0145A7|nr:ribosome recycling factor [Lactobacillus sp. S2-2]MCF6514941.1 ribosome recycling factor [Lactobacillus sp. S2-2]